MENYNRQRKHSKETNTFLTMPCVSYARRASTSVETRPGTIFARSPPTFTKAYSSCSIVRPRNYPHIYTHAHAHKCIQYNYRYRRWQNTLLIWLRKQTNLGRKTGHAKIRALQPITVGICQCSIHSTLHTGINVYRKQSYTQSCVHR